MQTVFAVVQCAVAELNVFLSSVLTCSLIFLQLSLLGRSVEPLSVFWTCIFNWSADWFKSIQWHIDTFGFD